MDLIDLDNEASQDEDAIIVKADEVDEEGADISLISPSSASNEQDFNAKIESRRAQDAQATGSPKVLANAVPSPPRSSPRPILRREGSVPPSTDLAGPLLLSEPEQQKEEPSNPTDSLSLSQLRRLVADLPKHEPAAYAYEYEETRSFPEELQEWFEYTDEDRNMILTARNTFENQWQLHRSQKTDGEGPQDWTQSSDHDQRNFINHLSSQVGNPDLQTRVTATGALSYIVLGCWNETAGLVYELDERNPSSSCSLWLEDQNYKPINQLYWMNKAANMLCESSLITTLLVNLQKAWNLSQNTDSLPEVPTDIESDTSSLARTEIIQTLTCLYVIVEANRFLNPREDRIRAQRIISEVQPSLLTILTKALASSRWEDRPQNSLVPQLKVTLLLWKSVLLLIGTIDDAQTTTDLLSSPTRKNQDEDSKIAKVITASPIDYHLFRQEIISKYPAYNPPPTILPIEPENNSMLPPLHTHSSRQASHEDLIYLTSGADTSTSILTQPVHIATPAPSPPPSPAGPGGKGGKKQNYQTNQTFPFLYPPLDDASNSLGGKGSARLQDKLAGRKWEGGDVPLSIIEAGELFAYRTRMSRSIGQLWDVREQYIKGERCFENNDMTTGAEIEEHQTVEDVNEEFPIPRASKTFQYHSRGPFDSKVEHEYDTTARATDPEVQKKLEIIQEYYSSTLPDMHSLISVLWKQFFPCMSALVSANGQGGLNTADDNHEINGRGKVNAASNANIKDLANIELDQAMASNIPSENIADMRSREICAKAVSATLLILLKWFKVSHILRHDYLTQLMLDANFIPLFLKYFTYQDVDKAVGTKTDRADMEFFNLCHTQSRNPPSSSPQPALSSSESSEDEAVPPAIRKHRRSPTLQSPPWTPPPFTDSKPEVDELGVPTNGSLPLIPITTFAPRFFLININLLRILQKITKRKAHRALLLVQYKSSAVLRKMLKIPQSDLRLYALKLFKSQVPYCGRKWRQNNMRVITAIYLHCRPELRDEWLCGGDVDGVVEEALPLEQAGRNLVHWWHMQNYRDIFDGNTTMISNPNMAHERPSGCNFFERELVKRGVPLPQLGGSRDDIESERHNSGQENGYSGLRSAGSEEVFERGPPQMDGWA